MKTPKKVTLVVKHDAKTRKAKVVGVVDPSKPVELRIPKKKKLLDREKVSIRKAVLKVVRMDLNDMLDVDWEPFARFSVNDATDPNDPNFIQASRLARKTFKHLMKSLRRELRIQADNLEYFP